LVPPGTIIAYAGAIDGNPDERINGKAPEHPPPPGWLWCNGNQLNGLSAKFAGLYAAIGITFGGNGGSQAFNLPDLRGVFLRGQDQVRGQGQGTSVDPDTATRKIGSFQGWSTAQARNVFVTSASGDHTHAMSTEVAGAPMWYDCAGCNNWHAAQGSNWGMGHASHTHNINNAGTHTHSISGGDDETRPSNITVNYLIKY
jgi:microcystin-dependent protein